MYLALSVRIFSQFWFHLNSAAETGVESEGKKKFKKLRLVEMNCIVTLHCFLIKNNYSLKALGSLNYLHKWTARNKYAHRNNIFL